MCSLLRSSWRISPLVGVLHQQVTGRVRITLYFYPVIEENYLQFFTASIVKWKPVLQREAYKQIVIESLRFLVLNKRVKVYAFVIMPNHIHLIWQIMPEHHLKNVQRDFLKFTGQQILKDLRTHHTFEYKGLEVNLKDRKHQVWQRNPLTVDLYNKEMIEQKLDYIHHNPVQGKWSLVEDYCDYPFSSASFYEENDSQFDFLTHYMAYFGH